MRVTLEVEAMGKAEMVVVQEDEER